MFLFGFRRFGRLGPLGVAYAGYRLWRRLSPAQKQALRARTVAIAERVRAGRPPASVTPRVRANESREAPMSEADKPAPAPAKHEEAAREPSAAEAAQEEQARQEETGQESPG